jgi:predicted TIM-barrel fold metal-dependent hydrolase
METDLPIVDCHVHFIDAGSLVYPHFQKIDPGFVEIVGDYSNLPRTYVVEDYLKDTEGFPIVKTVMAEFVSQDPLKEVRWAQQLADRYGHPHGIIALACPLDPRFESLLIEYKKIPNVRAIREHMLWHPDNPLKRFAKRPDLLLDPQWRAQFAKIEQYGYSWEFEIYSHQIPQAVDLAEAFPNIQMLLHPMGWPLDLSKKGFHIWKSYLKTISRCSNVAIKITALSCIFRNWTVEQVSPWIREAIEIFTPQRSLFGSHMPIEKLDSHSFKDLYCAYQESIKDLSLEDQKAVFSDTALRWYRL